MQKPNTDKSQHPKNSENQSALTVKIILAAAALAFVILNAVGYWFVTEHSVRIAFVTVNALSLLTLVIIALQTVIYRKQWDVMERQLIATEKAAEAAYIAQRAYIGIADLTMESKSMTATAQLIVGEIPTLHVTWHNGGNTPARNFRAVPYLVFGEKPERRGYLIDDDWSDIKGSFLPAGKEVTMLYDQAETGFKPVTEEMIDDINSGKKRLYAMVTGIYIDYADKTRRFETGAIYKPFEGSFTELHEYHKQE
jgi:hypothetical protein